MSQTSRPRYYDVNITYHKKKQPLSTPYTNRLLRSSC